MGLRITAVTMALLGSTSAFSMVTLTVPEEIKIVAVNDQKVNSGLLRSNQTYKIDPGVNTISARYNEFFEHHDSSHDILKSGVVTIKTPELKDGEAYNLALINAPQDFDEAKAYKDQPIIGLYNANQQLLVQQAGAKASSKRWFGGGGGDNANDLSGGEVTIPVNQPAAIYTQHTVKPVVATVSAQQSSALNSSSDQQMVELWKKASKSERQKFMAWLAEQAN